MILISSLTQMSELSNFVSRLKDILFGKFELADARLKQILSWKILCFVSSTFLDTKFERNLLQEKIGPVLMDICRPYNVSFTFVDMRFGVKDENTRNHQTWEYCQRMLNRCFVESTGLY